jgi:CMD domain protein
MSDLANPPSASSASVDVTDSLSGLGAQNIALQLRDARADVKRFAQGSDNALFEPGDVEGMSLIERHTVALRVGVIAGDSAIVARHRAALAAFAVEQAQLHAVETGAHDVLPLRMAAALRFAETITRQPRDATPSDMEVLASAGFDARGIVTLAQLVAYLSFQVRLLAGLRALGGAK